MLIMLAESSFNWTYILMAITAGLLVSMLFLRRGNIDKTKISELSVDDFLNTMRKGTLVDTRKAELVEEGKILGAKSFPKKSGAGDSQIRKDIPIFLYDQNGKNVYSYAKSYVKNGAVMVYTLKGGYIEYMNKNNK